MFAPRAVTAWGVSLTSSWFVECASPPQTCMPRGIQLLLSPESLKEHKLSQGREQQTRHRARRQPAWQEANLKWQEANLKMSEMNLKALETIKEISNGQEIPRKEADVAREGARKEAEVARKAADVAREATRKEVLHLCSKALGNLGLTPDVAQQHIITEGSKEDCEDTESVQLRKKMQRLTLQKVEQTPSELLQQQTLPGSPAQSNGEPITRREFTMGSTRTSDLLPFFRFRAFFFFSD